MNLFKLIFLAFLMFSFCHAVSFQYNTTIESYSNGNQSYFKMTTTNTTFDLPDNSNSNNTGKLNLQANSLICMFILFLVLALAAIAYLFLDKRAKNKKINLENIAIYCAIWFAILTLQFAFTYVWVINSGGAIYIDDAGTFITNFGSSFLTAALAFIGVKYKKEEN